MTIYSIHLLDINGDLLFKSEPLERTEAAHRLTMLQEIMSHKGYENRIKLYDINTKKYTDKKKIA